MRVSRTRFSKRRSKRKTVFPVIAVVKKRSKPEYHSKLSGKVEGESHSFGQSFGKVNEWADLSKGEASEAGLLGRQSNSSQRQAHSFDKSSKAITEGIYNASEAASKNSAELRSQSRNRMLRAVPAKKSRATIDYKNVVLLRKLITAEGKILPRRINKLTAKQQRAISKEIKSARVMGLLPFINKSRPLM